jgi:FkbM family methyltransferase
MKIKLIDGSTLDIPSLSAQEETHVLEPKNYTKEILEEWDSEPFKELITKEDRVVLDIGANIGLFAIHILPYAEKIICVEPTANHMAIQTSLMEKALDSIPKEVFHEQAALNSYTGKAKFRTEPVNTTMNTIADRPDSYEVDCINLLDLCKKYTLEHVDLCKVDIEGSELQAITLDTVLPVSGIIKKFIMETHPRSREMQDHFINIFRQAGYFADYHDFNGSVIAHK